METKEYDLIIIGGGAAGLTAAIYAARRTLATLVIAKDIGGQANLASSIENYPGRYPIGGYELVSEIKKQAEEFGAQVLLTEVSEIKKEADEFIITTPENNFKAKALILAFGLTPRDLGVPGEREFKNKGVSYCANCDGPLFKDKTVAIVGGGNSALDAAEYLSRVAKKVYLIHRADSFRGEQVLIDRVKEIKTIELFFNTEVKEIKGTDKVNAVLVQNNQSSKERELECDGVFVEVGYIAKTDLIKEFVKLNPRRQVIVNNNCETSCPGIFAAGDVTNSPYKQLVIAAGEGAKAALQAYQYLQKGKNKTTIIDWGK